MQSCSALIPRAPQGSMSSSVIWKQALSPDHYAQLVRYHYDQVLKIAIQSFTTQSHKPLKTMLLNVVILCLTLVAAGAGLVMLMIQPNLMMPTLGSGVLDVSNISVVSVLFESAVILGIMLMIIQFTSRPSPQKTLEPQTTLEMIHDEIQKQKATSADLTQGNFLKPKTPATTVRASKNSKETNVSDSKSNASPS